MRKWVVLVLVGLVSLWANGGYALAGDLERGDVLRVSNDGSIDIEVVFKSILQGDLGEELEFEVFLNTHSGDLSTLDLSKKGIVTVGDRQADPSGITWEFTSRSAHHPAGLLRVENRGEDGKPLIDRNSDLVLEINDVGGSPSRIFIWEAQLFSSLAAVSQYFAYIPNAADGTVSVISIPEWKVVNTFNVGGEAAHGVAASPDGEVIYVGGRDSGILYAFGSDGSVIRQTTIADHLHGVDITKDGEWLFITGDEKVYAVSAANLEVQQVIDLGEGNPSHVDFSPDGSRAYITNLGDNNVAVINIPSFEILARIPVGQGPNESRVSPDGTKAYVANWESNDVSVIDTNLLKVINTIPVGQGTHGVAVSADGRYIVTANRLTNDISIIDAQELRVLKNINTGEYANHVAFSPDGLYLFVTNQRDNEVVVLDATVFNIISTIPVGAEPHEITFGGF